MKLVGVTGGFCAGKTTISAFFKDLGARVIDADKIAHVLYRKDREVKNAILRNFGKEVFKGGRVNRKKLAAAAFGDRKKLRKLCRITHPKVIRKIREEVKQMDSRFRGNDKDGFRGNDKFRGENIVIIDAPLLIEAGLHKMMDSVLVVNASPDSQLRRSAARGFTRRDTIARRASQMPLREKMKFADFAVDTNKPKKVVRKEIERIWNELKRG